MKPFVLVLAAICTTLVGCRDGGISYPPVKMDPEEAGYHHVFGTLHAEARHDARALYEALGNLRVQERLKDSTGQQGERSRLTPAFERLKATTSEQIASLEESAPPASMRELHDRVLVLFRAAKKAKEPADVEAESLRFFEESRNFANTLATRSDQDLASSDLKVTFKPLGLPFNVSSDGTFDLDLGVNTPVGPLSLQRKWEGIRQLSIKYEGKTRYVSLDRDFDISLFLPREFHCVDISVNARRGIVGIAVTRTEQPLTAYQQTLPARINPEIRRDRLPLQRETTALPSPRAPSVSDEQPSARSASVVRVNGNGNRVRIQHSAERLLKEEYWIDGSNKDCEINIPNPGMVRLSITGTGNRISACCEGVINRSGANVGPTNVLLYEDWP